MAKVWIGVGYGVYDKERVAEILLEFLVEIKARDMKEEFLKAFKEGKIYYDRGMISVDESTQVVDVFLDVLKRYNIVPAIT